jgi:hypothetical protein
MAAIGGWMMYDAYLDKAQRYGRLISTVHGPPPVDLVSLVIQIARIHYDISGSHCGGTCRGWSG